MRCILGLVSLLMISSNALADASVTIFVKETHYSIDSLDEAQNTTELAKVLEQTPFSALTLDIDYCADAAMVAEVYVALAKAKLSVEDVHIKATGGHQERQCNSKED